MEQTAPAPDGRTADGVLLLKDVDVHYDSAHVLHGIGLRVDPGQIVCLLGRNGAGKSTTLKSIMGLTPVTRGDVFFDGRRLNGLRPHAIAKLGIAYVPEDRRVFASLTVEENLRVAFQARHRADAGAIVEVLEFFPDLKERLRQPAGSLSGGQQQMLVIARGLVGRPRLLLIDEPMEGLAPMLVQRIRDGMLAACKQRNLSVLLVEQNSTLALGIGEYFFVLSRGICVFEGTRQEIVSREDVIAEHLGVGRVAGNAPKRATDMSDVRGAKRHNPQGQYDAGET